MTYLKSIHLEGQALKSLMKERKDLIQVKKKIYHTNRTK